MDNSNTRMVQIPEEDFDLLAIKIQQALGITKLLEPHRSDSTPANISIGVVENLLETADGIIRKRW